MKTSIRATVMRMEEQNRHLRGMSVRTEWLDVQGEGSSSVKEDSRFLAWMTVTKPGNERRSRRWEEREFCPK